MNVHEMEVLKNLVACHYTNQRTLAEFCGCSLGMVNRCLISLESSGYITSNHELTETTRKHLKRFSPQRAIILAAGVGMRMVPINMENPKALIEVKGEILIERLIRQLQEVGIREIYVVVGFMKEQFEYLIDQFGVELIVNRDYASSNNLHSICLVKDKLSNAYILPCDLWCKDNPFSSAEVYSWYMVSDRETQDSDVRLNRKQELVRIAKGEQGNSMVGISYITAQDAPALEKAIENLSRNSLYNQAFWEEALYEKKKMSVWGKLVSADQVIEINTYEQMRELDGNSQHLKSNVITKASQALNTAPSGIQDVQLLKKGMNNRTFLFTCRNRKYVIRIPREDTHLFVNHGQEVVVYDMIREKRLCDDVVYMDARNGYKISRYIENAHCCDPKNKEDLQKCMCFLREFHQMKLKVKHEFDIFENIDFYESLWGGCPSAYRDYKETKKNVFTLRDYIANHVREKVLTHIDAVPDNFLLYENTEGEEKVRLIDWEYAAMQDPHVDIAMFAIYALYNKGEVDHLIDVYFQNQCPRDIRIKIYCYVAACGLLWSNWCEYKRSLGIEFGEYSLRQYRYAKEFYRYAKEEM